ncbi:MAG: type II toxin-antitoxin system RelE/ParE family toxin [Candidatus Omnitrophica bacterium]|nr:type II toxin-antitoxin system RelE/ParE family toxin [Candidatus Omnitrophota bacterium]
MKYFLVVDDEERDLIRHLPPDLKRKVKQAFTQILQNPAAGKALSQELKGLRSYRIGQIRIIYKVSQRGEVVFPRRTDPGLDPVSNEIFLITLGDRKTIYQKAALELKQRYEQPG